MCRNSLLSQKVDISIKPALPISFVPRLQAYRDFFLFERFRYNLFVTGLYPDTHINFNYNKSTLLTPLV